MSLLEVATGGWLFYPIITLSFIVFGIIGWFFTKENKTAIKILEYMIENHLDEWEVSKKEIINGINAPQAEVERELETFRKRGVMYKGQHGWALRDPLVFLTKQGYSRARRLTKNDNILYGGYQVPYKTNVSYLVSETVLGILGVIILVLTHYGVFNLNIFLGEIFGISSLVAALFIFGYLVIVGDVFNNFLKRYTRERYSIIIGEKSGISYDISLADELSGRIERHEVENVDIDLSIFQKIVNSLGGVPIGDLLVWKEGSDEPIRFKNIPYPREAFFLVRGLQLGALEWRKQHAKNISYWKSGAKPTFS